MPRITETATLARDPESLWNEIGAFGSVGDWHPMLNSVEVFGEGAGALRVAHVAHAEADATQAERLEALDPARHLYRYSMEKTSMPVCDYEGEFRIDRTEDDMSTVVWSARFELTPDGDGRTVESVRHFLRAGTESLRRRFGETGG